MATYRGERVSGRKGFSSRSSLDVRSTELVTVAALTALQYPREQLQVHIESALAAGCSPEEIIEVIFQMALYAGLPAVTAAGKRLVKMSEVAVAQLPFSFR